MAAIEESGIDKGNGDIKVRSKKISTRVDMTPMVDLGFLLITFFMLATTMSKPTAMSVFFPDKTDETKNAVKASGVLTLFLGANDKVHYLDGIAADDDKSQSALKTIGYGSELRRVIFAAQRRVRTTINQQTPGNETLIVVIKPTSVSSFKNMVDVLDEMAITKSKRYALVDDLTNSEKDVLGTRILPEN